MKTCAVQECANKSRARGWCGKHYQRWNKYGDPEHVEVIKTFTLEDAMAVRTEQQGDCLIWTGSLSPDGYAMYNGGLAHETGTRFLHRALWIKERGMIPKGLELDHMCYRRNCINMDHLRLATRETQTQNLAGLKKNNTSGVRGVYWSKRENAFLGVVKHNKKAHYVGRYETAEEARPAVEAKRLELHGINPLKEAA